MPNLSENVTRLSPSATFEMAARSAALSASGIDVVNLSVGEPDFNTPDHIKEAARKAIEENYSKYSPVVGYASLREAVCAKLLRENGLVYEPSEILISGGAKQSVCNAVMSLAGPGDEVIIPAPYWVSYPQMINLAGGTPVFIPTSIAGGFKITPESLEAAITPKTKLLILCSPCNPTGAVYSKQELEALAQVVLGHEGLYVLSDEIYEHICYVDGPFSIAACPGMRERTIVVNGVSKAYAMTGWRIGFMAAPRWIVSACGLLQGQYTSGPCSVSQKAAEAAWNGPQECVESMRESFRRRRDLMVRLLRGIPGLVVNEPEGAFYIFPDCSSYSAKVPDLAMYLLEQAHVATVNGSAFGAPGHLRLSYATSEDRIEEAAGRIKSALELLRA